jgi:hypothetical protein
MLRGHRRRARTTLSSAAHSVASDDQPDGVGVQPVDVALELVADDRELGQGWPATAGPASGEPASVFELLTGAWTALTTAGSEV